VNHFRAIRGSEVDAVCKQFANSRLRPDRFVCYLQSWVFAPVVGEPFRIDGKRKGSARPFQDGRGLG
jgi:hypothetical protein